jgi:transposase-like protein
VRFATQRVARRWRICRQLGVSEASLFVWKKKYGKLGLTELRELRTLRDERWSRLIGQHLGKGAFNHGISSSQ